MHGIPRPIKDKDVGLAWVLIKNIVNNQNSDANSHWSTRASVLGYEACEELVFSSSRGEDALYLEPEYTEYDTARIRWQDWPGSGGKWDDEYTLRIRGCLWGEGIL